MDRVSFIANNSHSICVSVVLCHIKLGMLRVLGEVTLDAFSLGQITKSELLKVVFKTELIVGLRVILQKLVDEPCIAVRGEE